MIERKKQADAQFQFNRRQEKALRESETLGLPCPRLQLTWVVTDDEPGGYNRECLYTLVLPLRKHDIRAEMKDGKRRREHHALIGHTRVSGNSPTAWSDGKVDTPFRDHSHTLWDAEVLGGLPIYAVSGTTAMRVEKPDG